MLGMGLGWLIILLLIVFLIYYLSDTKKEKDDKFSAREILDIRYAKGDITEAEYKTKRDLLKK